MALIYVHDASPKKRKKRKTKAQIEAEKEHLKFLQKIGYTGKAGKPNTFPSGPKIEPFEGSSLQKMFGSPGGFKHSVDDAKWKKGRQETQETLDEIERKKKRIGIAYNKGGYQYLTEGTDPRDLGKKTGGEQ